MENLIGIENIKEQTFKQFYAEITEKEKNNPNIYSHWISKIDLKKLALNVGEYQIIHLPENILEMLLNDGSLTEQEENAINIFMMSNLKKDTVPPFFMKNGLFSNKFQFDNCIITNCCQFAKKLKQIYYAAMCYGVDFTTEVVLREVIPISTNHYIYDSMPLNLEYRFFVDVDKKEIVDVLDYWHLSIKDRLEEKQKISFELAKREQTAKFETYKEKIKQQLQQSLENNAFKLNGIWSIDVLVDYYNNFWLIDMATANKSWGVHLLSEENQKRIFGH
ncbi:hypothetical protein [Fusobacterium necrophorum]|uniref:hypothetical protein n=1 Tax=Fusobacterium necrophorum TaxID=859 RepID=UPI00370E1512